MPARKPWTVLVLIVAKSAPGTFNDPHYINAKANEVKNKLEAAAKDRDMYVAYNIIYDPDDGDPKHREPFACILNPEPGAVSERTGGFMNSNSPIGETLLQNELLGFYAWALPRCPAERYAVFFWGHSLGPAGLFEDEEPILLPTPEGEGEAPVRLPTPEDRAPVLLATSRVCVGQARALNCAQINEVLKKARRAFVADCDCDADHLADEIRNADPKETVVRAPSGEDAKVDVVLFQDCWMSTLETAFQLEDSARFVVASQSLVPFGKPSVPACGVPAEAAGMGIWPYDRLFDTLEGFTGAPGSSLNALVDDLGTFYDSDQSNNLWPNPSLPFALLDLNRIKEEGLGESIRKVIAAFKRVKTDEADRGAVMDKASIAVAGPRACLTGNGPQHELAAGSIALIDFKRFCRQLADEALTPDEKDVVRKILDSGLVVRHHESIDTSSTVLRPEDGTASQPIPSDGLGFGGISAFYYPTTQRTAKWGESDKNIFRELGSNQDFYQDLVFNQKTGWGDELAFDQLPRIENESSE